MSLFYGLNISRNALNAQTAVLNVTAHNVANANTPGYSRQTVLLSSISDNSSRGMTSTGVLRIGSGVEAKTVARARFELYDQIWRKENQDYNDFVKTEELMHQIELLFDEPTDRGLSAIIDDFFNGWQEVASNPQNMAARESLKSIAEELAGRLHRINNQLDIMSRDIDTEIANIPPRLNEITSEIADLNVAIRLTEAKGTKANDLRDKRDSLVDELSEYADVKAIEQSDGTYTVIIGNRVVVERDSVSLLTAVSRNAYDVTGSKTAIVSPEGIEYVPQHGKLGALIRMRDEIITEIKDKLDTFTKSLVETVNYEHRIGYGLDGYRGRDFFDANFTKAFNIRVSTDIDDVTHIAVSSDGSTGDNGNALMINDLKNRRIIGLQFTFSEYYNTLIADIGIMARQASSGRMNEELLVTQIDNAREGIKGVSIDEELIIMMQSQRIYQGASRMIVVIDSMLESIINMK